MPSSQHRAKRPFAGDAATAANQRSITSFFAPATTSTTNLANAATPSKPILPASVQANLLTVGMRIRKSIPDGHKTVRCSIPSLRAAGCSSPPSTIIPQPTAAAAAANTSHEQQRVPVHSEQPVEGKYLSSILAPPFSSSLPELTPPSSSAESMASQADVESGERSGIAADGGVGREEARPAELLPFCGINKVGGLSVQTGATEYDGLMRRRRVVAAGTGASEAGHGKRVWMDDEEAAVSEEEEDDDDVIKGRTLAVPVRRALKAANGPSVVFMGQNDDEDGQKMIVDDDFPEADFLLDYSALEGSRVQS